MSGPGASGAALAGLAIRHGAARPGAAADVLGRVLAPWRGRAARVLLIGLAAHGRADAGGAELWLWAEFFGDGRVVGLDALPRRLALPANAVLRQGRFDEPAVLDAVWRADGPFDIVVEAGVMPAGASVSVFRQLYPRLPADGLYVAEGVEGAFRRSHDGAPLGDGTLFELAHRVALGMHPGGVAAAVELPHGGITGAVHVLPGVLVFARGAAGEPAGLEAAVAARQGPGAFALRAGLLLRAGDRGAAALAAAAGLAAFPGDAELGLLLARASEPEAGDAVLPGAFDGPSYLALNPDLAAAGVDPAAHYLARGAAEGRRIEAPVFDPVPAGAAPAEPFWGAVGRNAAAAAPGAPPRLAVFATAYRRPEMLPVLMHAMDVQTRRDFRLVVMHDGPDDAMLALVRRVAEGVGIAVEWRFSRERHGQFGHALRARAIEECAAEFLVLTNDDNYYVPGFVAGMLGVAERDGVDMVLCDMVHSYPRVADRRAPAYEVLRTAPARGRVDMGCVMVRTALARAAGFGDRGHAADGRFVEALMARGVRWGKAEGVLFVHN